MHKVEHEILQPQGFGSIQNNGLPIGLQEFWKGLDWKGLDWKGLDYGKDWIGLERIGL